MNVAPSLFAVWDPGVNELKAAARFTVGKFLEITLPELEGLQEASLGIIFSLHLPLLGYLYNYTCIIRNYTSVHKLNSLKLVDMELSFPVPGIQI